MLLNKFIYIKFKKGFMLCCIFVLNNIYVRVVDKNCKLNILYIIGSI